MEGPLEAKWQLFKSLCIREELPPSIEVRIKLAFFSGAKAMMCIDNDLHNVPDEEFHEAVTAVNTDMDNFMTTLLAGPRPDSKPH